MSNPSGSGYVVIARSSAGTIWVAGPSADNRISKEEAEKLAAHLRAPSRHSGETYSVKLVEAGKSALEGES